MRFCKSYLLKTISRVFFLPNMKLLHVQTNLIELLHCVHQLPFACRPINPFQWGFEQIRLYPELPCEILIVFRPHVIRCLNSHCSWLWYSLLAVQTRYWRTETKQNNTFSISYTVIRLRKWQTYIVKWTYIDFRSPSQPSPFCCDLSRFMFLLRYLTFFLVKSHVMKW